MAEQVLDFKASVPSNTNGGSPPLLINAAPFPPLVLADLGIFLTPPAPASNRVELVATVGIRAISGVPRILFQITRDGNIIFTTAASAEPSFDNFYTVTFETVDFNVSSGFHVYTLTAQVVNPPATANVVGPVTFSGLAIGPVD